MSTHVLTHTGAYSPIPSLAPPHKVIAQSKENRRQAGSKKQLNHSLLLKKRGAHTHREGVT